MLASQSSETTAWPGSLVCKALLVTAVVCLQHYLEHDLRLRRFVPIIHSSTLYPVVLDAKRTVLSLPPIINGSVSAVQPACVCKAVMVI